MVESEELVVLNSIKWPIIGMMKNIERRSIWFNEEPWQSNMRFKDIAAWKFLKNRDGIWEANYLNVKQRRDQAHFDGNTPFARTGICVSIYASTVVFGLLFHSLNRTAARSRPAPRAKLAVCARSSPAPLTGMTHSDDINNSECS